MKHPSNFTYFNSRSRGGRRQYLVTYAKADLTKFPTRESFAEAVVAEFNHDQSVVKVIHWACCQEGHQDGSKTLSPVS